MINENKLGARMVQLMESGFFGKLEEYGENPNEEIKQGGAGDPYQYKKVKGSDGSVKYFYAKKGDSNWVEQKNQNGIANIKKYYFPEDLKASSGAAPVSAPAGNVDSNNIKAVLSKSNITNGKWNVSGSLVTLDIDIVDAKGERTIGQYLRPEAMKGIKANKGTWKLEGDKFSFFDEAGKLIYSEKAVAAGSKLGSAGAPNASGSSFFDGMNSVIGKIKGFRDKFGTFRVRNIDQGESIGFYDSYNNYIGSALNPTKTFKDKAVKGGFSQKGYFTYKKVEQGPHSGKMALFLSKDKNIYLDEESSYYYVG